jgi:Clostridium P-47 protein
MQGISTGGWDLVYAMRFSAVNAVLSKNFNTENTNKSAVNVAIAKLLAEGFKPRTLYAQITDSGTGYKSPPLVNVEGFEGPITQTTATAVMGLERIIITNPLLSPTSSVTIHNNQGAQISIVSGKVAYIKVTDGGSDYNTPPHVKIDGGGGIGATADAEVSGGVVTAIKITNPGSGYTFPPTVTIDPSFGNQATADASIVGVQIDNPGAGFTTLPTIIVDNVQATAEVTLKVVDVTISAASGGITDYLIAPLLKFDNTGTSGHGATAYAMLGLNTVAKHFVSGDDTLTFARRILKKAFLQAATSINQTLNLDIKDLSTLEGKLDTAINGMTTTDTVESNILTLAEEAFQFILDNAPIYKPNATLFILQSSKTDIKYQKEAQFILESRHKTFDTLISELKTEELIKNRLRVQRALRSLEASIVFNYTADPGVEADYYKKISELPSFKLGTDSKPVFDDKAAHLIVNTAIAAATALTPEVTADQIVALGRVIQAQEYPFQKIALYTDAWQLKLGGDDERLAMKIPLKGGLMHFEDATLVLKPEHKFYIELELNLVWLKGSSATQTQMSSADKSVKVLAIRQEDGGTASPLTADDEAFLLMFVKNTLNKVAYKPDAQSKTLAPLDYAFEYNHTFASLDIYENMAEKAGDFAWMYPTSVAYAVKDQQEIKPDLEKSVFAICCMTENRDAPVSGSVDFRAIPEGSTSSVLISKSVVLTKFILPYYLLLFKKEDGATVPDITTDFTKINDGHYKSRTPLLTKVLGVQDPVQKAKTDTEDNFNEGKVPKDGVIIKYDNNLVSLEIKEAEFSYVDDSLQEPYRTTKVVGTESFFIQFQYLDNKLSTMPNLISSTLKPTYNEQEAALWWKEFLYALAVGVVSAGATALICYGPSLFCKLRCRRGQSKVHSEESASELVKNLDTTISQFDPNSREATNIEIELQELRQARQQYFNNNANEATILEKFKFVSITAEPLVKGTKINLKRSKVSFKGEGNIKKLTVEFEGKLSRKKMTMDISLEVKITIGEDGKPKFEYVSEDESNLTPEELEALKKRVQENLSSKVSGLFRGVDLNCREQQPVKFKTFAALEERVKALEKEIKELKTADKAQHSWLGAIKESVWSKPALIATVGMAFGGAWMYILRNYIYEKPYEQYKINVENDLANQNKNGEKFLAKNLTSKIKSPSFVDQNLVINSINLNDSLIIGLSAGNNLSIEGLTTIYNPMVPFAHLSPDDHVLVIENTGSYPIEVSLILNEHPYQGHFDVKAGNSITVPAQTIREIDYTEFGVERSEHLLVSIEAVKNSSTFTIMATTKDSE